MSSSRRDASVVPVVDFDPVYCYITDLKVFSSESPRPRKRLIILFSKLWNCQGISIRAKKVRNVCLHMFVVVRPSSRKLAIFQQPLKSILELPSAMVQASCVVIRSYNK